MKIQIPVQTHREFYEKYLTVLNTFLSLNKTEIKVLASYLTLYDKYQEYNPEVLDQLLFSGETAESIRNKLVLSEKQFSKTCTSLSDKGLIKENKFHPGLLHPAKNRDYNINIEFKRKEK